MSTRRVLITGSRILEVAQGNMFIVPIVTGIVEHLIRGQSWGQDHNRGNITIVDGACPGEYSTDRIVHTWALGAGFATERHPANWQLHGLRAGPIRNQEMVNAGADLFIGVLCGESRGTRDCVVRARDAGIRGFLLRFVPGDPCPLVDWVDEDLMYQVRSGRWEEQES